MNNIWEQAKKWWDERNFGQKFTFIFLSITLVGVLTYLFALGSQPDWDVLYDDLSSTDASAVASQLKDSGIVFKVTNGGKTILVPSELIAETRLDVAEADVIKDDEVGYEAMDKMPIGLTDQQQKMYRLRIIQGELTRTIKTIKGVKNARISIAIPDRSIFASQDENPSASVMLTLNPGIRINQDQIKAIKNLVSHSVARLQPENVFVTDQSGKPLSEEIAQSGSSIDELRRSYEMNIEKKVEHVLSKLVGAENITVAVTADMNFDRTTSKIERFIPTAQTKDGSASGVLVSEQLLGEQYTGQDGKGPGGIPGAASNINNPNYAATGEEGDKGKSSDYNKNSSTKNYEISKEIKDIVYAPGQIERLTVAVAVNKVLTAKEENTIEELVLTASGSDAARGDIVTVTGMSFDGNKDLAAKEEAMMKQAKFDQWFTIADKVAPYLLIVLFGGLTLAIFWSLIKKPVVAQEYYDDSSMMDNDFEFPESPEILEAASIPVIEAKLDPEIERMRNEINQFVMNDPGEAARLLLSYIKD